MPEFQMTYCSQCGAELGPGDAGVSRCSDHRVTHTPGPWGVSSESPKIVRQYDFLGETNVIVGSASGYANSAFFPSDEEAVANARLIAGAPDLLAALTELLACVELENSDGVSEERIVAAQEAARAAIAKAFGA